MLSGVSAATASGHSTAGTYGPPVAHAPPMPMTARIDSHRRGQAQRQPGDPHEVPDHGADPCGVCVGRAEAGHDSVPDAAAATIAARRDPASPAAVVIRTPTASWIAPRIAGAVGTSAGSPTPFAP